MQFVGQWEWGNRTDGAYTNDPKDHGGETKFGISKRAHPREDIKNLTLSRALEIYQSEYWNPVKGDDKPFGMACAVMDTAVNCGVSKALKFEAQATDPTQYLNIRLAYYNRLVEVNDDLKRFTNGWRNRVNDLKKFISIHSDNL